MAVVANPYSGSRKNPARVEALAEELRRLGCGVRLMWGRHELKEAAGQPGFLLRFPRIVVAGGDGTLHKVVNTPGVLESGVPLAHFPLGTENLFARQFDHPHDPARMAQIVAAGKTATIDLGTARYPDGERVRFMIVASAGFDAEVIHRLELWRAGGKRQSRLRRVSRSRYVRPILGAVTGYNYPAITVQADDRRMTGVLCMAFNLPRYGMGLGICPDATASDGLLDYAVFQRPGAVALMRYALSIRMGRHTKRADVLTGRARHVRIAIPGAAVPLELDGEGAGYAPVELGVLSGALRVLVP